MTIAIEGVDALGKSTQIQKIKEEFEKRGISVHILHYSNIKAFGNDNQKIREASYKQYRDMLKLANYAASEDSMVLILDRSHIGEAVYSPLYRDYNGDFVFEEEKTFIWQDNLKRIKLILFTDDAEAIIKRDKERNDGQSFSLDPEMKKKELDLFDKAFEKSILNKKRIELKGRDAEQIWNEEVKPFIFDNVY